MKFTLSWLKDHLDTNKDLDTIVDTLTNIGLEIESVQDNQKILMILLLLKYLKLKNILMQTDLKFVL